MRFCPLRCFPRVRLLRSNARWKEGNERMTRGNEHMPARSVRMPRGLVQMAHSRERKPARSVRMKEANARMDERNVRLNEANERIIVRYIDIDANSSVMLAITPHAGIQFLKRPVEALRWFPIRHPVVQAATRGSASGHASSRALRPLRALPLPYSRMLHSHYCTRLHHDR